MPFDLSRIRSLRPQTKFHYFPTLNSTMLEATRLAEIGAQHGTVVLADEQTAGIGRLGRSWVSEPDLGIYCSILLDLGLPLSRLPVSSLLVGLATADAIQGATNVTCDLRWPNDVLIHSRKVAGILSQLVQNRIVVGIGVNVNHMTLPSNLRTPATSLLLESGRSQDREELLSELLNSIDRFCDLLAKGGPESILKAFSAASSYVTNRPVLVEDTGQKGITAGLDENGFLLLRQASGDIVRVTAGGVRPDLT